MNNLKQTLILFLLPILYISTGCGQNTGLADKSKNSVDTLGNTQKIGIRYKVTFIELGSVKCIPCQKMQAVMKSIESKYGKEVKVDFHDVWTEAGKPFGVKYGIEAIPTQIFLDQAGKEYFRHVGFFPEEELVKILKMKGVDIK